MKVREKYLAGNPQTTTCGVGVSGFSGIYERSSLDVVCVGGGQARPFSPGRTWVTASALIHFTTPESTSITWNIVV